MKKNEQQKLLTGVFFVLLVFLGFYAAYNRLDPDVGWHIKTGQLILERGIPHKDWYSYTMPDFPWIDHEWLMNILIFKLFAIGGLTLLSAIFVVLYALSFFISRRNKHSLEVIMIPFLLGYGASIGFLGIRPQLITVLFFSLCVKLLYDFLNNSSRWVYMAPLLFLLWANLHGGFLVGLALLVVTIILELFKKTNVWQKVNFKHESGISSSKIAVLIAILACSFTATLINPYGLHIYTEVFRTIHDSSLRFSITEWMPIFLQRSYAIPMYLYIVSFLLCAMLAFQKIKFNDAFISFVLLVLSVMGARHFLIFIAFTLPMFSDALGYLIEKYQLRLLIDALHQKVMIAFFMVAFAGISVFGVFQWYRSLATQDYYPQKALSFLKTLPLNSHIFNYYGWGGYLIWQLPEQKVFIDGRMPSWQEQDQSAFKEYRAIMRGDSKTAEIFQKYNVDVAVIPQGFTTQMIQKRLGGMGWNAVYYDDTSIVFTHHD